MVWPPHSCPHPRQSQSFQEHLAFLSLPPSLPLFSLPKLSSILFTGKLPLTLQRPDQIDSPGHFPSLPQRWSRSSFLRTRTARAHSSSACVSSSSFLLGAGARTLPRHGPRVPGGSQPQLTSLPPQHCVWCSVCPQSKEERDGRWRSQVRADLDGARVRPEAWKSRTPRLPALASRPGFPRAHGQVATLGSHGLWREGVPGCSHLLAIKGACCPLTR